MSTVSKWHLKSSWYFNSDDSCRLLTYIVRFVNEIIRIIEEVYSFNNEGINNLTQCFPTTFVKMFYISFNYCDSSNHGEASIDVANRNTILSVSFYCDQIGIKQ